MAYVKINIAFVYVNAKDVYVTGTRYHLYVNANASAGNVNVFVRNGGRWGLSGRCVPCGYNAPRAAETRDSPKAARNPRAGQDPESLNRNHRSGTAQSTGHQRSDP